MLYAEFKDASGVTNKPVQDATATFTEGLVGNHLPVFEGPLGDQEVEAWDRLTFQVAASDADGDSLMVAAERLPFGAVFDSTTWTFQWRPVAEQVREDPYLAAFSISDGDTTVSAVVRVYVGAPSELRLFEGPEIPGITDHEAVVWWRTNMPSDSWVEYGLEPEYGLTKGVSKPVMIHRVLLTALWPDTTYYYRVRSVSAPDTAWGTGTFRTEADTLAPKVLTGPDVVGVTDSAATVSWATDELSDSWVEYGFDDGYGLEAGREEWVRKHGVRLTGLEPDTTITLRVRSVDRSGNVGFSETVTFRTRPTPDTKPPRMILAPVAMARTDEAVTVAWTTDEVSNSWLTYGVVDTTTHEVSDTSYAGSEEMVTEHRIRLAGFEAGAVVRYRVSSTDPSGNRMMSGILTFRTKAAPDVSPPRILTGPVVVFRDQYSAVIEWTTNELSDSWVEYGETSEYGLLAEGDERVRVHRVAILDLESATEYHIRVRSTDISGNETVSEGRTFRTKAAADVKPPVILKGPAVVAKTNDSATIVWTTDEPSDSWVTVGTMTEIAPAKILAGEVTHSDIHGERRGEGRDVRVHTVVLTNLSSGTRYSYWVGSTDPSGNGPTSKHGSFVTMLEPDADPPVILSGPMVYWTDRIATVKWRTDERSTSVVYYGTVETYGTDMEEESAGDDFGVTYVRKHRVTLTGLVAGVRYYYRVRSVDLEGNAVVSGAPFGSGKRARAAKILQPPGWGGDFTTNSYADTQVPVILSGPGVQFKNDSRVTIGWETDERSDSVVEYAIENGGAGKIVAGETFPYREEWAEDLLDHVVTLTNLSPGALVRYRVGSTDPSGNGATWSSEGVVQTDLLADTEAPEIVSGPEVLLRTDRSVVLGWDTDEPGDSVVEFGLDRGYGSERNDMEDVTGHRITLTNLTPLKTYHYRVGTTDPSGNGPTWSVDGVFETQAEPDRAAPRIVSGPEVVSRTDVSVVIAWVTDELADSYVKYGEEVSYGFNVGSVEDVLEHRVELTNLLAGTLYHYHVGSIDRSGNGPTESADFTFVTDAQPDTEAPAAPSGLSGMRDAGRVVLSWTKNAEGDVVGYNVYRKLDEGAFGAIATLVSDVEYSDAGGTTDQSYTYRITAVDGSGNESGYSEEVLVSAGISGDFDGDGKVFTEDFVLFVDHFGLQQGDLGYDSRYDLNGDGKVFTEDFVLFVDSFGSSSSAKISGARVLGINEGVRAVLNVSEAGSVHAGKDCTVFVSEDAETVALDVFAEGATQLKGYGITLRYDPEVLSFVGAEPAAGVEARNLLNREGGDTPLFLVAEEGGSIRNQESSGRIWLANALRGPKAVSGDGLLAHVRFEVIGALKGSFVARVEAVDLLDGAFRWNGVADLSELSVKVVPRVYALEPNFPNPFNSVTRVSYQLPEAGEVGLSIYNMVGQRVRTLVKARQEAGYYQVVWDGLDAKGRAVGSGVYLVRIESGEFTKVRKMALMK
ncbi:MAG: hypothetical protein DRJ35_06145 [Thermoprotei archaeon]|nr:MAG: hypothetical protein DRJ35_06145 [Thermoprotei archaeon]